MGLTIVDCRLKNKKARAFSRSLEGKSTTTPNPDKPKPNKNFTTKPTKGTKKGFIIFS